MTLDRLARRYGQRPSTLVGITDGAVALSLDLMCEREGRAELDDLMSRSKDGVQPVIVLGGA